MVKFSEKKSMLENFRANVLKESQSVEYEDVEIFCMIPRISHFLVAVQFLIETKGI